MIPDKRPTDALKDEEVRQQIEDLQESALGNIIQLDAAPTAGTPLIEANTLGSFENNLYIRIANVILKVDSDSQITIT